MFNNIYVVKDKISGVMTSQLMIAANDLVAIKGFADSLKNLSKELALDSQLFRIGSISESGNLSTTSSSGIFPKGYNPLAAESVLLCDSTNFNEKFEELLEKYNDFNEGGED